MSAWLADVLSYHSTRPLLYTQLLFWAFFTIFFGFYLLVHDRRRGRSLYLTLISLFLYYKAGGYYFTLLIFSTLTDYHLGRLIYHQRAVWLKKLLLTASVIINLGVLFYFKYTYFIVDNVNNIAGTGFKATNYLSSWSNQVLGTEFDIFTILLPVGISFYTFQTISYTADIYRGKVEPVKSIIDFAFYVSFFPQLVAGPIVRAAEFVPQITRPYRLSHEEMSRAFFFILNGLVKKILISDYISINFVDRVFAEPLKYTGFENLMAIYGYAIQIYCDFSGYSDIAIGMALLLGFRLPVNFNSPYKSLNITDFWRRWHISLSSWLRDYLYIPLGGNRKGRFRTDINLMLTMLLGGLWHGANLRFVLWGGMHGAALVVHKLWKWLWSEAARRQTRTLGGDGTQPGGWLRGWVGTPWSRLAAAAFTFHFVCFCWIFFRAPSVDMAMTMLRQIGTFFRADLMMEVLTSYPKIFLVMLMGYVLHALPADWKERSSQLFIRLPDPVKATVLAVAILLLYQVKSSEIQPFIYFQF